MLLGSFNSDYIQGLVDDGITAGCSVVAAALLSGRSGHAGADGGLRVEGPARRGSRRRPARRPGTFADVPCPGGFAVDYIEGIYDEGITAGCGNGNYCPDASITNAQMAVFLVKAFDIPYLP